jgi:hypothetical protein
VLVCLNRSWTQRNAALTCALGFIAMALVARPCAGQETADSAAPIYPVKGVVLNSVTHQPIARALVDAHETAVLTDNDGRFELSLPAGGTQISLRRPGYGARGRATNHSVQVGANMPALTFYLTPEALITGQVMLSTADAADGIRVMAYRRRITSGRETWMMQSSATTNSDGVFRIAGLQPGSYLLYTQPTRDGDGAASRGTSIYGYPAAYYPGVADISAAGLLTLTAGQHAEADFTLTRQEFYSVTVMIANHEAGGMNLQVHDRSGRQMSFPVRWNAMQGTAQMNVPSGSYFLEGRRRGEAQLYGRVDFTVAGAPLTGLNMALLPLHAVPVTVRKVFTATNTSGSIGFGGSSEGNSPVSAGLNIVLTAAEEFFGQPGGGGMRSVEGASDGSSYEIENVSPGRYWVETTPFEGYVSSITSGGVDLARDPLVIGPGGTSAPIEVTLRNDTGTISAQLSGGGIGQQTGAAALGEQQQIYVYAIPLFASSEQIKMGGVQGTGQTTIAGLAPGSYRVVAVDAPQEIDYHTPEGLAKYAGQGETVTVDAGGSASAQLDVIHTTNTDVE